MVSRPAAEETAEFSPIQSPARTPGETPNPQTVNGLHFAAIQVPPPRAGEILVIIVGGPAANKGRHWVPSQSTLGAVLELAGLNPSFPPRTVWVVEPDGRSARYRVAGRPRADLDRIRLNHGSRIVVPYDRCFSLGPDPRHAPGAALTACVRVAHPWRSAGAPAG